VKLFQRLVPWILLAIALFILPAALDDFRLNLFGRYFALSITALAIDLIWGYTGLLSLGQGIFFALGGYAVAMNLMLNTKSLAGGNGIPKFFENYGVLGDSRSGSRCGGLADLQKPHQRGVFLDHHPGGFDGLLPLLQRTTEAL